MVNRATKETARSGSSKDQCSISGRYSANTKKPNRYATKMIPELLSNGGYEHVNGIFRNLTRRISTSTTRDRAKIAVWRTALAQPKKIKVGTKHAGINQGKVSARSTRRAIGLACGSPALSQSLKIQLARRSAGISKANRIPTMMQYPRMKGIDRKSTEGECRDTKNWSARMDESASAAATRPKAANAETTCKCASLRKRVLTMK